VVAIILQL